MSIEEKLQTIIIERYGSMVKFSKKIGMANSTLATIMKSGIHKANVNNIVRICSELGISADELVNDRIVPIDSQPKQIMTEMNDIISYVKLNPDDFRNLTIDGIPLSDQEITTLLDFFGYGIETIKRNRNR